MPRQFNRYAAGRKVYGGGRSNPTSGTVDPTGYIERSANNMASDRRSGLAQSAIQRRIGRRRGGPTTGVDPLAEINSSTGYTGPTEYMQPQSTSTGQNYAAPVKKGPMTPAQKAGLGTPGTTAQTAADHWSEQRVVDNWQPPIDPLAEAQEAEAEAERQRFLATLAGEETNLRAAAGRRLRDLETQQPIAQEGLTNDFAGRGLAYSGRYATDRGDLDQRFASEKTNVGEDLKNNLLAIEQSRAGTTSEIEATINRIRTEAASRNAENPNFRAPVVSTPNPLANSGGVRYGSEDASAIEAIKRRLAGPWKRL